MKDLTYQEELQQEKNAEEFCKRVEAETERALNFDHELVYECICESDQLQALLAEALCIKDGLTDEHIEMLEPSNLLYTVKLSLLLAVINAPTIEKASYSNFILAYDLCSELREFLTGETTKPRVQVTYIYALHVVESAFAFVRRTREVVAGVVEYKLNNG